MVTKRLRNPRARSSALASLGTLQPRALGSLNRLVTLVSAPNLYVVYDFHYVYFPSFYAYLIALLLVCVYIFCHAV